MSAYRARADIAIRTPHVRAAFASYRQIPQQKAGWVHSSFAVRRSALTELGNQRIRTLGPRRNLVEQGETPTVAYLIQQRLGMRLYKLGEWGPPATLTFSTPSSVR